MPITINKNSSATVLTINNFSNLTVDGSTPYTSIADLLDAEDKAILLKADGATMLISFDYTIMGETSTVVSGTGSPVTTAPGQFSYLFDTLMSKGSSAHTDTYTLTIDFGGGVTFQRTGEIVRITAKMSSDQPLTFVGSITFSVGTNPMT